MSWIGLVLYGVPPPHPFLSFFCQSFWEPSPSEHKTRPPLFTFHSRGMQEHSWPRAGSFFRAITSEERPSLLHFPPAADITAALRILLCAIVLMSVQRPVWSMSPDITRAFQFTVTFAWKKNPVLIFNPSLWYYFTLSPFAVTLGDGDYHSQTQIKLTKLTSDLE